MIVEGRQGPFQISVRNGRTCKQEFNGYIAQSLMPRYDGIGDII